MLRETASRERTKGYGHFEGKYLESIKCIKVVPLERGSISREHNTIVDLRDLLEEIVEANELLEVELRIC